ncbi:hypothetical protein FHT70_000956 [Rhizobium sp. BK049]|nr:hypothetical protein [Rhizobium sp. BK049]
MRDRALVIDPWRPDMLWPSRLQRMSNDRNLAPQYTGRYYRE